MRPDHANGHGAPKGGPTHETSRVTFPLPIASTALRDKQSLGKLLDACWRQAETGNQHLGLMITCLGPNSTNFSYCLLILPKVQSMKK